jgi:hypothetical protein
MDYLLHFILEAVGGGCAVYAYTFCTHFWHRALIWFTLTALTTLVTVQLVG